MSSQRQSTAAVIRVKGVSFNYLQFLWTSIATVKKTQEQGNFAGALALATELIDYLPTSLKEEFKEKAAKIQHSINMIASGNVPQIKKIPDFFIRGIYKTRLLQKYSSAALSGFINELTTKLDNIGYMENTKVVAEGSADMDQESWMELQEREGKKSGRRKKGSEAHTGSLD
jgi:hypothetical protein